jgi:WD40-like Beta Propeller Repeat
MILRRIVVVALALVAVAPARASGAALIAAYDRYEVGQGFQIGMVNVSTGAAISLPAGVNTAADEIHPTLSKDGRFLWFSRLQLQPTPQGDVIPPEAKSLVRLDRNTGTVTTLATGIGPPTYTDAGRPGLTVGKRATARSDSTKFEYGTSEVIDPSTGNALGGVQRVALTANRLFPTDPIEEVTQAVFEWTAGAIGRSMLAVSAFNAQGVLTASSMRFESFGSGAQSAGQAGLASHPLPRPGDGHIVYQSKYGSQAQIFSFTFPNVPGAAAPTPISSGSYEGMPAWSPDLGKYLGFVRNQNGRRALLAFDTTPGIQDALNPPLDLGAEAPTPQLRLYQEVFGGMSLANTTAVAIPTITCSGCASRTTTSTQLSPQLTSASLIGIFIARDKGTKSLFGRKVPSIAPVGRVPLGQAKKGRTSFEWDGKVDGKRLKAGRYLLTFRSLKGERITNTSGSIGFKVDAKGTPKGFKAL